MHYFSNVRKIQFLFAEELTDYTYSVSISVESPYIFLNSLIGRARRTPRGSNTCHMCFSRLALEANEGFTGFGSFEFVNGKFHYDLPSPGSFFQIGEQ